MQAEINAVPPRSTRSARCFADLLSVPSPPKDLNMQIVLLAVTAAVALLVPGAKANFKRADGATCPANSPLSCSAAALNGPVDSCCVNSPGGYLLQ